MYSMLLWIIYLGRHLNENSKKNVKKIIEIDCKDRENLSGYLNLGG